MSNINYRKLLTDMNERGMTPGALATTAALDGIRFASKTRLHEAFRDTDPIPLRDDVAQQILNLWGEITTMQFWVYVMTGAPLKLDFKDGQKIYDGLVAMRKRIAEEQNNSSGNDTEPANNVTAQG